MKKTFLILVMVSFNIFLYAQTYHPFPTKNAMWTEMYYKPFVAVDIPRNVYHGYRFKDQDTTINGKIYHKVFHSYDPDFTIEKLCGGIREENKRVHYYVLDTLSYTGDLDFPAVNTEFLLYDFSLNVGDSISSDMFRIIVVDFPGYVKVVKIDSVLIGQQYHRIIQFGRQFSLKPYYDAIWIEGIGNINGLLYPIGEKYETGSKSTLICFFQEDINLYHNPTYNNCFSFNHVRANNITAARELIIKPNPIHKKAIVEFDTNTYSRFRLMNIFGVVCREYNTGGITSLEIDKENLPSGIYFLLGEGYENSFTITKMVFE